MHKNTSSKKVIVVVNHLQRWSLVSDGIFCCKQKSWSKVRKSTATPIRSWSTRTSTITIVKIGKKLGNKFEATLHTFGDRHGVSEMVFTNAYYCWKRRNTRLLMVKRVNSKFVYSVWEIRQILVKTGTVWEMDFNKFDRLFKFLYIILYHI